MLGISRKIMVAVDGSAVSDKAVYEAVWLACSQAGKFKNKLFAVFVKANGGMDKGLDDSERWQQIVDEAFLVFRKLTAEKEVPFETLVVKGDPANSIIRLAREYDIDLVVIGSTGKGAMTRTFLGSVSAEVIKKAPCGVYVVRA